MYNLEVDVPAGLDVGVLAGTSPRGDNSHLLQLMDNTHSPLVRLSWHAVEQLTRDRNPTQSMPS